MHHSAARRAVLACLAAAAIPWLARAAEPGEAPGPAYLVYTGPYSQSPSSAFGHLFLVLAERSSDPPPLWTVVTFNAVTFDADPIRYLTVGVLGGFPGRFDRFAFHQKTRDYQLLDDRDLWLLELRLSPEERRALSTALLASRGRWFPYDFFFHNCAFYLQGELSGATGGAIPPPGGVVSPTSVFGLVERSRLAGPVLHRPAVSRRIAGLAERAPAAVVARLRSDDWREVAADQAFVAGLDRPGLQLTQALFELRALETTDALQAETQAGLARLRLRVAEPDPLQEVVAAAPAAAGPGEPVEAPSFHGYQKLGLRWAGSGKGPGRIWLSARAAMQDESDPWLGQQPVSTLELLAVEASTPADRAELRLETAILFAQRSLGPSNWIRRRTSWLLEVLARRGGLLGALVYQGELRGGVGKALALPGNVYAHAFVTLAAVAAPPHGAALAPGLEAGLVLNATGRLRLGATWKREHDALAWRRFCERARAWARLDLGGQWGLVLAAEAAPTGRIASAGVEWSP